MTFTKNNFKSPHIFIFWILFVVLATGTLVNYFLTDDIESLYISGFIFLFLIFLFIIGFMTKITINEKGITHKSLFKNYFIKWNEIRTINVYKINKYFIRIVKPEDYTKFSMTGQTFIYFSKEKDFIPKKTQQASLYFINLHWRQEVWDEIAKHLHKTAL